MTDTATKGSKEKIPRLQMQYEIIMHACRHMSKDMHNVHLLPSSSPEAITSDLWVEELQTVKANGYLLPFCSYVLRVASK